MPHMYELWENTTSRGEKMSPMQQRYIVFEILHERGSYSRILCYPNPERALALNHAFRILLNHGPCIQV
jgi:hypothetical protein